MQHMGCRLTDHVPGLENPELLMFAGCHQSCLPPLAFGVPWQGWSEACFASGADECGRVQAAAEILGRRKGEQMAMLVHHSRNSVQKQWEETLVLALSGMGRILRAHLPVLITIAGFSQVPLSLPTAWH